VAQRDRRFTLTLEVMIDLLHPPPGKLCVIRPMAIGDSGACRSPIPVHGDQ
jgi:hypothetical protein